MKICNNCQTQNPDDSVFCINCGVRFESSHSAYEHQQQHEQQQYKQQYEQQQQQQYQQQYQQYHPVRNPYDHTSEFDAKDISENKVISMLVYLMGPMGILIALLASKESPYVAFHLRQALKFQVVSILLGIIMFLLCWTFIVPLAGAIMILILGILQIVAFFQICAGKAKEPAIIRDLNFLK